MKIMNCPLNGPRNISEFSCLGEVRSSSPAVPDDAWAAFIWNRDNKAGLVREWWCHLPTTFMFVAERNTLTDEIVATYPFGISDEGAEK
jgi:sarcosine oxidase, subunit delta